MVHQQPWQHLAICRHEPAELMLDVHSARSVDLLHGGVKSDRDSFVQMIKQVRASRLLLGGCTCGLEQAVSMTNDCLQHVSSRPQEAAGSACVEYNNDNSAACTALHTACRSTRGGTPGQAPSTLRSRPHPTRPLSTGPPLVRAY